MINSFFTELNYTATNEDSLLEYHILPDHMRHVVSIAGSGSRVIPLIAKFPQQVTCIDSSQTQLFLTELRIEAVRTLSYPEYLFFWGYPQELTDNYRREELFQKLTLNSNTHQYIQGLFEKNGWQSLLYEGKWERTFKILSKINRAIVGKQGTNIFNVTDPDQYHEYLSKSFPYNSWRLVIRLLGNATLFNTLLYRGSFPKKNIPSSFSNFYIRAFDKLFQQGPVCRNYFLQIIFFGKIIYPTGLPAECDPTIYHDAKKALEDTKISYIQGDIFEKIQEFTLSTDFISLSDVPSYLQGSNEQNFLQKLKSKLSSRAIIVARYYLHIPSHVDYSGYKQITSQYIAEINDERVQMYSIEVLRKSL